MSMAMRVIGVDILQPLLSSFGVALTTQLG